MKNCLVEKNLKLANGYHVHTITTGKRGSENDGRPYLLLLQGGPGLPLAGVRRYISALTKESGKPCPYHFILFDTLGSGLSDKALNPNVDYSPDGQTELAAQVVEAVAKELNIKKMDLRVLGESGGSITAMTLPKLRPEWVGQERVPIQLNQVLSISTAMHGNDNPKSIEYVREHYQYLKNLSEIIALMEREYSGGIRTDDHNRDFAHLLAVYSLLFSFQREKMSHSLIFRAEKYLLTHAYHLAIKLIKSLGHISENFKDMYEILTQSSVEALNEFNKNEGYDFDIGQLVKDNRALYEKLPICALSGIYDHVCNPAWGTNDLANILPNNFSYINFNSKHAIDEDFPKTFFPMLQQLLTGGLKEDFLQKNMQTKHPAIHDYHLAPQFAMQSQGLKKLSNPSHTSFNFSLFNNKGADEAFTHSSRLRKA